MKRTRTSNISAPDMSAPDISAIVTAAQCNRRIDAAERSAAFLHLIVLLGLTVAVLMSSIADARATGNPEVATLAVPKPTSPLTFAAVCDAEVAVFTVKNNANAWRARGTFSVVEAKTGRVVRERRLALGERQSASFRVASAEIEGEQTRMLVRLPDQQMTYVKSFAGRCVAQR